MTYTGVNVVAQVPFLLFSFDVVSLLMLLLDRLNAYIKQTIRNTVKFYHDNVTLSFRIWIELAASIINDKHCQMHRIEECVYILVA